MAIETLELPSGLQVRLVVSRKSALGNNPGKHYIAAIFRKEDDDEKSSIKAVDVSDEDAEAAMLFAYKQMKNLSANGAYRIGINGPGAARREDWHCHLISSDLNREQLAKHGREFVQLVSETSFIVPASAEPKK